jgi:protein CpxP
MVNQRKKVWPWIFGIGLFVNVLALVFFGFNELQHRPFPGGPQLKNVIADELQLDEQQRKIYAGYVKNHQNQSAEIRKEIADAKKAYYQFENQNPRALQQLTATYGKLDSLNYAHFRDIRGLCKGPQIKAFDCLVEKILTSSNFGFMGPRQGS